MLVFFFSEFDSLKPKRIVLLGDLSLLKPFMNENEM